MRIIYAFLIFFIFTNCSHASTKSTPRDVVISLDGFPYWLYKELKVRYPQNEFFKYLKQKNISHKAQLIANFPSKTAPGHASLFTGYFSDHHGITGNSVFLADFSKNNILETQNGFRPKALQNKAEAIWITLAKKGISTRVYQATHSLPLATHINSQNPLLLKNLKIFEGYLVRGSNKVIEFNSLEQSQDTLYKTLKLEDKNLEFKKTSPTTIEFKESTSKQWTTLNLGHLNKKTIQFSSGKSLDLIFIMANNKDYLYFSHLNQISIYPETKTPSKHPHAFGANGAGYAFSGGVFGPTLQKTLNPNNNSAEKAYLETVLNAIDSNTKNTLYFQKTHGRGQVEFHYLPFPDELLHQWAGYLLPTSPFYKKDLASVYWNIFNELFSGIAKHLNLVIGTDLSNITFVTDHGMDYKSKSLYLNSLLKKMGYLNVDTSNNIDLPNTKVVYPKVGGFFFKFNYSHYKDGSSLTLKEKDALTQKLIKDLMMQKDNQGKAIFTKIWKAEELKHLGATSAPWGGELYFELQPGLYPSSRLSKDDSITKEARANSTGVHGFYPLRATMKGAMLSTKPLHSKEIYLKDALKGILSY